jgi:hypothetical protein
LSHHGAGRVSDVSSLEARGSSGSHS